MIINKYDFIRRTASNCKKNDGLLIKHNIKILNGITKVHLNLYFVVLLPFFSLYSCMHPENQTIHELFMSEILILFHRNVQKVMNIGVEMGVLDNENSYNICNIRQSV